MVNLMWVIATLKWWDDVILCIFPRSHKSYLPDSDWPEISSLPSAGTFKWKNKGGSELGKQFMLNSFSAEGQSYLDPLGFYLLSKLLTLNSRKRILKAMHFAMTSLRMEWRCKVRYELVRECGIRESLEYSMFSCADDLLCILFMYVLHLIAIVLIIIH